MRRRNPNLPAVTGVLACVLVVGLAAGCGPTGPAAPKRGDAPVATEAPPSAAAAPSPTDPTANLQQLSTVALAAPLKWDLAEGVIVTAAPEDAKSGGGKAVRLTPTTDTGLHRVGFEASYGGGKKTYHVVVWAKGAPGTDMMMEARGKTMVTATVPADDGRAFFDLATNTLLPDQSGARFGAATIVQDGDWKKVSVDMTTRDGWLYMIVGLTTKGHHVFAGTPDMGLTIGGVEVTPAG
jgi:hypothetical protein